MPDRLTGHPASAVTVVIAAFGAPEMTDACVISVLRSSTSFALRVLVVDDGSPQPLSLKSESDSRVQMLRLDTNLGYLQAVNHAVPHTAGPWTLLLNNDAFVEVDCIEQLVGCAESAPDIGAVGAAQLTSLGGLNECGGIVWADGTAMNFGRGDHPALPPYRYRREVDYASAAALLVRGPIFREMGGFDPRFAPAYYEDTDLCFALRARGYRVMLEPRAKVVHDEGMTHGTELSAGVKRYQGINAQKFQAKWRQDLEGRPLSATKASVGRYRERSLKGRILWVDDQLPRPLEDSGSVRAFRYQKLLRDMGWGVTVYGAVGKADAGSLDMLASAGIEAYQGVDLRTLLEGLSTEISMIVVARPVLAWSQILAARRLAPSVPILYDTVDLHFVRESRASVSVGSEIPDTYISALRDLELSLMIEADGVAVVSREEADLVASLLPDARIFLLPNIHDETVSAAPFEQRNGFVFVGNFHHSPNLDALEFLENEIMPAIRQHFPGAVCDVIGPHLDPNRAVSDTLNLRGWVPNLDEALSKYRVMLAPLRVGAGMKGKIGQALALGLPVVTTSIGAEGLRGALDEDLCVADNVQELASLAIAISQDQAKWERASTVGASRVSALFGKDSARKALETVLDGLHARSTMLEERRG